MCKSQAEGGQRCAAHTRPAYQRAQWGTPEWDAAAGEYAATREGRQILSSLAAGALRDGDFQSEAAYDAALRTGERLRAVSREVVATVNRQRALTRVPEVQYNEHWGDYTLNCGGYGTIEDDGMARWSSDFDDQREAHLFAGRSEPISKLVWDYQTAKGLNPSTKPIRLLLIEQADGSIEVRDYDWQHPVGRVHKDGTHTAAPPPAGPHRTGLRNNSIGGVTSASPRYSSGA